MNEEICYKDATELAAQIRSRALSPVEVLRAHLERIESINPKLNAIVVQVDGAMNQAIEAEAAASRGEFWGPLHGVPFTVKDCVDTEGVTTTRGSLLFADHVPTTDATVVERLTSAGGIFIGKTNMPEFALWWETDNRVYGRTENPWKLGHTPGGSSGGEAAAIATGLSALGIGSDVGGSIREPANYCGIVGLKATHGRIPLTGHWPEVLLRYMHVGPLARTVRDAALAFTIMAGPDRSDPYALPMPVPEMPVPEIPNLDAQLPNLRVGWCPEGPFGPVSSEVQATVSKAASALEEMGCGVEQVSLDGLDRWPPQDISGAIFAVEGGHYLEPIISGREDQLAPSMQRRLTIPAPTLKEYLDALAACELLKQYVTQFFSEYHILLCPTGPLPAHPHSSIELDIDGQNVPGRNALKATVPFDLTGSPAISVPFGWSAQGLPIGVQLVGRHFDETSLLCVAAKLEAVGSSGSRRPPV